MLLLNDRLVGTIKGHNSNTFKCYRIRYCILDDITESLDNCLNNLDPKIRMQVVLLMTGTEQGSNGLISNVLLSLLTEYVHRISDRCQPI